MKKVRQFICILMAWCLLATYVLMPTFAADDDFQIENGVLIKYHGAGGDVVVPDGVKEIGRYAFEFRNDITSVRLPEGLTTIGVYAFSDCYEARILNLPSSVRYIKDGAFRTLSPYTPHSVRIAIWELMQQLELDLDTCIETQSNDIQKISDEIVSGLKGDYKRAEAICRWVSENIQYDYEQYYGTKSYEEYSSVEASDVLRTRLTTCAGYSNLTVALLNAQGIPAIAEDGISGEGNDWSGHTWNEIYVDGRWILADTTYGHEYFDMDLYSFTKDHVLWWRPTTEEDDYVPPSIETVVSNESGSYTVKWGNLLTDYQGNAKKMIFPEGITMIGELACSCSNSLMTLEIPEGVTSIGNNAFVSCDHLVEISLPDSVTSIGKNAFSGCGWLRQATLPDGLQVIKEGTFYYCFNLGAVAIPKAVSEIEVNSFGFCESLTDVYYGGDPAQWSAIKIGEGNESLLNATIHYNESDAGKNAPHFFDVPDNAWYAEAAIWASYYYIAFGTGEGIFSPEMTCTTEQILTFLHRAERQPKTGGYCPYPNVSIYSPYYNALCWAYECGFLVPQTGKQPNSPCTRSDVALYLWKLAGEPTGEYERMFSDVSSEAEYAQAVAWAAAEGITEGASSTTFNPEGICTRAEIVTFLYRYYKQKA